MSPEAKRVLWVLRTFGRPQELDEICGRLVLARSRVAVALLDLMHSGWVRQVRAGVGTHDLQRGSYQMA